MFKKTLTAALLVAITTTTANAGIGDRLKNVFGGKSVHLASANGGHARVYNRPPESYKGQWFTTSDGCSYSRANPPGGRSAWYLIQNPHHIGQPNAHWDCAPTL